MNEFQGLLDFLLHPLRWCIKLGVCAHLFLECFHQSPKGSLTLNRLETSSRQTSLFAPSDGNRTADRTHQVHTEYTSAVSLTEIHGRDPHSTLRRWVPVSLPFHSWGSWRTEGLRALRQGKQWRNVTDQRTWSCGKRWTVRFRSWCESFHDVKFYVFTSLPCG